MLPLHQGYILGGNEWTRTTNTLRMKEEDYHCPTLPYRNTLEPFSSEDGGFALHRLCPYRICFYMVGPPGLEPGIGRLKVCCDNHFTTIPYWSLATDSNCHLIG